MTFSEPVTGLVAGDLSISVNGALLSSATDYTATAGTGSDAGKWVVKFTTAPATGASIVVKTNSNATGHDAALNPVEAGDSATVTAQ